VVDVREGGKIRDADDELSDAGGEFRDAGGELRDVGGESGDAGGELRDADGELRDPAARRRIEDRVAGGDYGPGAADEVTVPPNDEWREAQERDVDDPADAAVDPEVLRDGGPAKPRGALTTTGGTAGPASVRRRPRPPGTKVAPTTTGDATTGGMNTPAGGSTSDQSGQANEAGNFTDR
jgi:hypothetical protein